MYKIVNLQQQRNHLYFGLCQIAKQLDAGIVIIDPHQDYTIVYANQVFSEMTEYREYELVGVKFAMLEGPLTNCKQVILEGFYNNQPIKTSIFHYRKDGTAYWHELTCIPISDAEGVVQFHYITSQDVTDYVNMEALVMLEREVYADIEHGDELSTIFEHICKHVEVTFQKKCHCSISLFNGTQLNVVASGSLPIEFKNILHNMDISQYINNEKTALFLKQEVVMKDIGKSPYWSQHVDLIYRYNIASTWSQPIFSTVGEVVGLFSMYFEGNVEPCPLDYKFLNRVAPIVTLALKYYDQKNKILQLAYFDSHTGLSNIELFKKELFQQSEKGLNGSIYIIEPGEYQNIVDIYGRQGGDELLRQLGVRLKSLDIFKKGILARYTSSAVIIATEHNSTGDFQGTEAEKGLFEPYQIADNQVNLTFKIGTSNFGEDISIEDSIQRADTALSAALKCVGTVIKQYDKTQITTIQKEMKLISSISNALKNKEFTPVLQPKVNIQTGRIESFEALARWISKDLGFISPAVFISVAESTGNIHKVDRAILKKILAWQQARIAAGKKMFQVAINISPSHFYHPTFVEDTIGLIESYGVNPCYLKFEITESIELEDMIRAKKIICDLKKHGISTSIDDFGVGYSSLSYLQQLPFDEIKIDKSFIDNLAEPRMNAVVKTIIQLSADLQMTSVAEGIETEEQHQELLALGCHIGQGYYYYKPLSLHEVDRLLEEELS